MNVELYLSSLMITGLDQTAKQVVSVVISLADDDGRLTASYPFLAAAMAVHRDTVKRAADRASLAGYLAVDKPRGRPPTWRPGPRLFDTDPTHLMRTLGYATPRPRTADTLRSQGPYAQRSQNQRLRYEISSAETTPAVENRPVVDVLGREVATQHEPEQQPVDRLGLVANRLASHCTGNNRWYVRHEAAQLVEWAVQALALHRVEELVDTVSTWPKKPALPRALARPVGKAAAAAGQPLPPFVPPTPVRRCP